jgi:hypothetical protein
MADNLNDQWANELSNYLLNVIFVVNGAEKAEGATTAFTNLNLTAGPGWRFPGEPYLVDDSFQVQSFCLMNEALNLNVDVTPEGTTQCVFSNKVPTNLFFHLGPESNSLMCGPQLTPKHATPITNLSFTFGFNNDCTEITSGYLEGCIPQDEARKICLCKVASTCPTVNADPNAALPEEASEFGPYCSTACGDDGSNVRWLSFAGTLNATAVEPQNCTVDGEPGYLLSASFEAEEITGMFDPAIPGVCPQ